MLVINLLKCGCCIDQGRISFLFEQEDGKSLEFIKSQRGHFMLVVNGFTFIKESRKNDRIFWKCSRYERLRCTARCSVQESMIALKSGHNHGPEWALLHDRQRFYFSKVTDMMVQQGEQHSSGFNRLYCKFTFVKQNETANWCQRTLAVGGSYKIFKNWVEYLYHIRFNAFVYTMSE